MDELMQFLEKVLQDLRDDSQGRSEQANSSGQSSSEEVNKFENYLFAGLLLLFAIGFVKGLWDGSKYRAELDKKNIVV